MRRNVRGDEVNGKRRDGRSRYGLETLRCFMVKMTMRRILMAKMKMV